MRALAAVLLLGCAALAAAADDAAPIMEYRARLSSVGILDDEGNPGGDTSTTGCFFLVRSTSEGVNGTALLRGFGWGLTVTAPLRVSAAHLHVAPPGEEGAISVVLLPSVPKINVSVPPEEVLDAAPEPLPGCPGLDYCAGGQFNRAAMYSHPVLGDNVLLGAAAATADPPYVDRFLKTAAVGGLYVDVHTPDFPGGAVRGTIYACPEFCTREYVGDACFKPAGDFNVLTGEAGTVAVQSSAARRGAAAAAVAAAALALLA